VRQAVSCRQHTGQAKLGCGAGQPGQAQRFGLGCGEPGQPGAIALQQLIAATVPGIAVQRDARRAERFNVAVNRADRNLKLAGQLLGCHPPAGLQQQEQGQQAAGAHAPSIAGFTDSRWQENRQMQGNC
jgi:hypothetical protein